MSRLDRQVLTYPGHSRKDLSLITESIPLKPFRETPHPDPGVAKAQDKLKESIEKLGGVLQNYATKSTPFWAMTDQKMTSAILQECENDSNHRKIFQGFIEQILDDQEKQKDAISGKVASFMVNLIPLANVALGIVSLGANVSSPDTQIFFYIAIIAADSYSYLRPADYCP